MNKYKIEVKEVLRKNIIVNAETSSEALDYVENVLMKSNILDLGMNDVDAVEAKVLEKNGEKIEENNTDLDDDYNENNLKNEDKKDLEIYKNRLNRIDDARHDIEEILDEIEGSTNEIRDILFDCLDTNF